MSELPDFPYHPDPVATGAFERRTHTCRCCEKTSGWAYSVAPYAREDLRDRLCPECIADGSAAERFSARFTALVANDVPAGVDPAVVSTIVTRTPGFAGWDRERWLFCCGDAAAFLGPCGWEELEGHPEVVEDLTRQAEAGGMGAEDAAAFVGSLDIDGAATGYLFGCRSCGRLLAYADSDLD